MHCKKFLKETGMSASLVWTEIDLDAIGQNVRALKNITSRRAKFMAVVKADGYGHGAVAVAEKALESGADWLGVARLDEATALRNAGLCAPILIFGMVPLSQVVDLSKRDLVATVYSLDMAKAFSEMALEKGMCIRAHLKVDTGMGRVGILPDERGFSRGNPGGAVSEVEQMILLPGLKIEGMYTHFAAADCKDRAYTEYQLRVFNAFVEDLKQVGIEFSIYHAANSAAIIDYPESHFDMVRAGISIYGLSPSHEVDISNIGLLPAMAWKARVTHVKKVKKGFPVSYGMTCKTEKDTVIATVSVGYADGFSRRLSSRGTVLVRGMKAPLLGRVCMDQTLIDVGHIPGVEPGDEVVLIGTQGKCRVSADDLALLLDTINYEVVSSLTGRVTRFFV